MQPAKRAPSGGDGRSVAAARIETWAWLVQRAAAAFLALAVLLHLATIVWAVRSGLSAEAVLARTSGNKAWLLFYALFALATALHGAHGLRTAVREWTPWRGRSLDAAATVLAALLTLAGCRAAWGLYAG